jgi:CRISPR-associated endonuclease/helicase Cas3
MYIAHIREIDSEIQSIKEHLENTADRAKEFAESFNNGEYAYICGMLHDIGKYSADPTWVRGLKLLTCKILRICTPS